MKFLVNTPLVFLFCVVLSLQQATANATTTYITLCSQLLQSDGFDRHELVMATLRELLADKIISLPDLSKVLEGVNPLDNKNTPQDLEYQPILAHLIATINTKREYFVEQINGLIREQNNQVIERNDKKIDTKLPYSQLEFYPIEPGGLVKNRFWFANFPVTQWQYTLVMGENPSEYTLRPNNPVESTSVENEDAFIKQLNHLSVMDSPLLYKIIKDHKKFWRYRRTTADEWGFVASNRGLWKGPLPDGVDYDNIGKYAWYKKNSNGSTQPVGQLEPILVDGRSPIYDMYGNVSERTQGGGNYGGSWKDDASMLGAKEDRYMFNNFVGTDVGFRLVTEPPR